jgi:hypothetical protein
MPEQQKQRTKPGTDGFQADGNDQASSRPLAAPDHSLALGKGSDSISRRQTTPYGAAVPKVPPLPAIPVPPRIRWRELKRRALLPFLSAVALLAVIQLWPTDPPSAAAGTPGPEVVSGELTSTNSGVSGKNHPKTHKTSAPRQKHNRNRAGKLPGKSTLLA